MINIEYQQSVAERQSTLVLKFVYVKDLNHMYPFNVSILDGGKESEQGKGGVDVNVVINYTNNFAVNGQLVTVYLNLG